MLTLVSSVTMRTDSHDDRGATMEPTTTTVNDQPQLRAGLLGLMAVQAFVGYEWLMSGLAKLWRGGFASGLAA